MTFGDALKSVREDHKVFCQRRGWNYRSVSLAHTKTGQPYLAAETEDGEYIPYFPVNEDIFSEEWMLCDLPEPRKKKD